MFIDRKKAYLYYFLIQTQLGLYKGAGEFVIPPSNLSCGGRRPPEKNLTTHESFRGEEKMYPKNKQKVILIEEKYQFISCFWRKNVLYVKIFDFANKKYQYQGVFFYFSKI